MLNKLQNIVTFLHQSWQEALAVTWPTPQTIAKQFVIVVILSAILIGILYSLDMAFALMIEKLKQLFT